MVEVRFFGPLWQHLAPSLELDLAQGESTVADLLARLDINAAEVGIVTVDRRQSNLDDIVSADSRVCIFPPMSGG
jgi:molybdopterin converting factor small subunit